MVTKGPKRWLALLLIIDYKKRSRQNPSSFRVTVERHKDEHRAELARIREQTTSVCRSAFLQENQHAERQAGAIFRGLMSRRLLYYEFDHCNLLGVATHS